MINSNNSYQSCLNRILIIQLDETSYINMKCSLNAYVKICNTISATQDLQLFLEKQYPAGKLLEYVQMDDDTRTMSGRFQSL